MAAAGAAAAAAGESDVLGRSRAADGYGLACRHGAGRAPNPMARGAPAVMPPADGHRSIPQPARMRPPAVSLTTCNPLRFCHVERNGRLDAF
jgi:hypothetical protein